MTILIQDAVYDVEEADGPRRILDGLSLAVDTGELVCLLGPSGCGKSTLLKIVAGFTPLLSGDLRVSGRPVTGPSPQRVILFQEYGLLPWRTVGRNVELGLEQRPLSRAERAAVAERYLEMVGLTACRDVYPAQLSGGMRQRAALARALAVNPEILLMDEPLGALDALTRLRMQEEIRDIWLRCRPTVVLVTHDVDEAVFLGGRVLVMTPDPARIRTEIVIPLEHPRDRSTPEFIRLRNAVLAAISLPGAFDRGAASAQGRGWTAATPV